MDRTERHSIRRWFSPQMCYALAAVLAVFAPVAAEQSSSNVVIAWNNATLQGDRDSSFGPPMIARALAIVHLCMYDAWLPTMDAPSVRDSVGNFGVRP